MVGVLEKMFIVFASGGSFQQCVDRESFSFLYNSFPFGAVPATKLSDEYQRLSPTVHGEGQREGRKFWLGVYFTVS